MRSATSMGIATGTTPLTACGANGFTVPCCSTTGAETCPNEDYPPPPPRVVRCAPLPEVRRIAKSSRLDRILVLQQGRNKTMTLTICALAYWFIGLILLGPITYRKGRELRDHIAELPMVLVLSVIWLPLWIEDRIHRLRS